MQPFGAVGDFVRRGWQGKSYIARLLEIFDEAATALSSQR
jgi:hypothetical protein